MIIGMVVDNEFNSDPRVRNEAAILNEAGHTVRVACLSFGNRPFYEVVDGIEVFRFAISRTKKNILFAANNTFPLYHYWWKKRLTRFIAESQIEVLHAHDLYMALSASKAARANGIKMVLDLHENYPHAILGYQWATRFPSNLLVRPKRWKKLERKYLALAHGIIVLDEGFGQLLSKRYGIPSDHFVVYPNVPNVAELLSFSIIPGIFDGGKGPVLFYFGGISQRRGIYTCLEALSILANEYPTLKLLLIGPVDRAEDRRFQEAIIQPAVKERMVHIPWADMDQLPSYIRVSDVCLSPILKNPQHESGIANKVFQYMLFERPIIVSDCRPQQLLVNEVQCGLVFESGNAHSLAQSISTLLKEPDEARKMGKRGRESVLKRYNRDAFGKNLVSFYENL